MDLGIAGKRVLVTGASQGLGRQIAIDFAKEKCLVSVIARREDKLKELVEEMGGEKSGHSYYAGDLMNEAVTQAAVKQLTAKGGNFDIVINNVGGTLGLRDVLSPMEEWFRVLKFNVGIAMQINAMVIPVMRTRKWGRIVHVSSLAAEQLRGAAPYASSKAYLNAYVKTLGRAVAADGIVVSAVMPGAFISEGGHWDNVKKSNPEMLKDYLRHHQAVGRLGIPEDISPFVLFLASEQAVFASGTLAPIDGGSM